MTLNHAMALRVVWGTRLDDDTPAPDARELLEMCGLVEPGGHVIAPDITGGTLVDTSAGKAPTNANPSLLAQAESGRRPENCTTPPGLRDLPPLVPTQRPASAKERKPAAKAPRKPKPAPPRPAETQSTPKERKRPAAAACGTTGGYARHVRLNEPVCQPCRDAKNAYWREQHAARRVAKGLPAARNYAKVAACGTRSGYARHRRLGEEPCEPCRASNRRRPPQTPNPEESRLLAAGVNPEAAAVLAAGPTKVAPPKPTSLPAKRLAPVPPPIAHGTAEGWQAHHDRGALPPCAACKTAVPGVELDEVVATGRLVGGPIGGPHVVINSEEITWGDGSKTRIGPDGIEHTRPDGSGISIGEAAEPARSEPAPVKPDDWLAAAQRSPHRAVARAAAMAIGIRVRIEAATTAQLADGRLLARLDAALDDVARAQARASSPTRGAR